MNIVSFIYFRKALSQIILHFLKKIYKALFQSVLALKFIKEKNLLINALLLFPVEKLNIQG